MTEHLNRDMQLDRGRNGTINGWTLDPLCEPLELDGEFMLDRLLEVVDLHFPDAQWKNGDLPQGVYPMKRKSRTWKVNKQTNRH